MHKVTITNTNYEWNDLSELLRKFCK